MKLSYEQQELAEAYKKYGWNLEWSYPVDNKQRNCFWHGGLFCKATKNYRGHDFEVTYEALGEVQGDYYEDGNDEDSFVFSFDDEYNLAERGKIEDYIHTDKQLQKAIDDGRLELVCNNWVETTIFMDGKQPFPGEAGESDDVINEIWPPEELDGYLDDNYIEEELK